MGKLAQEHPAVRLLGRTSVRDRAGAVVEAEAWRTAKTLDLLRVLSLTPGTPVACEALVDLFWPAAGPARGGTSLRTAVAQLRRVLGAASIVRAGHGLVLEAWVDVDAYRDLGGRVAEARADGRHAQVVDLVRRAEELYAGDLDVTASDCAPLHDARTELRALRMDLLLDGAEAAGRCADWRQSLAFAQRAAEVDLTDRSTRALMRAWYAMGEAARPVEEFERLRLRLAEDFGVDPAPQTRALYLEVVGACRQWPPRETIVGRRAEVAQVVSAAMAWLLDPEQQGGVVWLVGEPGSGRDAVAEEAGRVMMLPVDDPSDPSSDDRVADGGPTLQRLADQGPLTPGLAHLLTEQARSRGRVLLVPVTTVDEAGEHEGESLVGIGALERGDFGRLLALVLQGTPTPELEAELFARTRGLPGLAAQEARARIAAGDLTWTTRGVDTSRRAGIRARIFPTLVSIPFALLGLFGSEGVVEASGKGSEIDQRERRLVLAR
jgi:DNA-binding SARP family transcriptional activator